MATVIDPRGLVVRSVAYWRGEIGQTPEARVTRQSFDAVGRGIDQWDPRLSAPALSHCYSLSGKVLAADSVDSGWRILLAGLADESLSRWDSRGTRQDTEYDTSLRPLAVTEQARGEATRVVELLEYGTADPQVNPGNQCGRLIRHDDPAGTRYMPAYNLLGLAQCEISHFLKTLDPPDWPLEEASRNELLEPGSGLESRWAYNPLGDLLSLTDAKNHRRHFTYTVAGQLKTGWLQPANTAAPGQCLVHDIRYNPSGQVERETAGNGVVTEAEYVLSDGRLERLFAALPNSPPLQDLRYTVDPVGNILQIDDHALPIRYYKNQRINAQCTYGYDTFGQLISATGREAERSAFYPIAPYRPSNDPNAVVNYREEYDYDAAGNMTELRHLGVQPFTRRWAVATNSNRSLIEDDQLPDFDSHFDDNGNLKFLHRGQVMTWDLRNQLSSVSPVVREGDDDTERYIYGGGGKRLRKVRTAMAAAHTVIAEVRYLPGLELHRRHGGKEHEVLDLEGGRNRVKWLHGPDAPEHPLRYHLTDHLGSSTVECDEQANVLSREVYYPFGGTAWEDHSDQSGAYKTIRYSGKERDATGLYYYGYRYFAPWLCRWINPDPAGAVDGLNLYCFVGNSPVGRVDRDGRMWSGNDPLFDNSQGSVPEEVLNRFVIPNARTLPPIDINEEDLRSQDSTWSMSSFHGETDASAELDFHIAMSKAFDSVSVQPISSPIADPSLVPLPVSTKRFPCETCNKGLSSSSALVRHKRIHTGEKPYGCFDTTCKARFSASGDRARHMKMHTGVKPLSCIDCGKSFARNSHLQEHRLTHAEEKKFSCSVCDKKFSQPNGLKVHMQTHSTERPYNCDQCGATFSNSSSAARHKRAGNCGKSLTCHVCGRVLVNRANFSQHMRVHT
ncbi:RHS repeat-associated core domain-containing protein [Pseudomonas sp. XS1P51]